MTKAQDDRKARLAQALRHNLRRRKAQSRETGVDDPISAPPVPEPPMPD